MSVIGGMSVVTRTVIVNRRHLKEVIFSILFHHLLLLLQLSWSDLGRNNCVSSSSAANLDGRSESSQFGSGMEVKHSQTGSRIGMFLSPPRGRKVFGGKTQVTPISPYAVSVIKIPKSVPNSRMSSSQTVTFQSTPKDVVKGYDYLEKVVPTFSHCKPTYTITANNSLVNNANWIHAGQHGCTIQATPTIMTPFQATPTTNTVLDQGGPFQSDGHTLAASSQMRYWNSLGPYRQSDYHYTGPPIPKPSLSLQ